MISSVTLPLVELKKPLPQKWHPQYFLRISGNSCWILRELLPLATLTKSLTEICGGISAKIWTWCREDSINNFNSRLIRCLSDNLANPHTQSPLKNFETIFCDPDNMIAMMENRMAGFAVLGHLVPFASVSSALYCGSGYQITHKNTNPTLLKF